METLDRTVSVTEAERTPEAFQTIDYVKELYLHAIGQEKRDRKRLRLLRWCALFLAVVTAAAVLTCALLLPGAYRAMTQVQEVLGKAQTVDMEALSERVKQFTDDATQSLSDVSQAMQVVEALDVDALNAAIMQLQTSVKSLDELDVATLNEAIKNLNSTIEPLAKLFGKG